MISKQNKMMLLFVSPKNPLWGVLLSREKLTIANINSIMTIANASIPNWKAGARIAPATSEKIFAATKEYVAWRAKAVGARSKKKWPGGPQLDSDTAAHLTQTVDDFHQAYDKQNLHIYDVTKILGDMPMEDGQKIIDEAIYDRLPVLSTFFYDLSTQNSPAGEDFARYEGVFDASMRRGDTKWLKFALRVRYLIEIRGGLALRCKLNAPIMNAKPNEYWEYDGFVSVTPTRLFWVFERRGNKHDYFFMITNTGRHFEGRLTLAGNYLTGNQDQLQSIASGDIILRRTSDETSEDKRRAMHTSPCFLTKDGNAKDLEELDDLLARVLKDIVDGMRMS